MPKHVLIPLIIACAMFMQTLDSTILNTAIPAIAEALDEPPLRLHLAITVYLLSFVAFLPLSGWLADQYGAKRIFLVAIVIFVIGSVACGLAQALQPLLLARAIQGLGGAMMVSVGRLILVSSLEKSQLVSAMILMALPAMLGPIVGPPLGGIITQFASWRWIFWLNVPVSVLGLVLVVLFIDDARAEHKRPFDLRGFVLSGIGLSMTLFGFDAAMTHSLPELLSLAALAAGVVALALYAFHARSVEHPILDLRVLRIPTLRAAVLGGITFRIGVGALPFLLPLMLQEGFGYSPVNSGLITLATAVGAIGSRGFTSRVLKRFGFRTLLVADVLLFSLFLASYALFQPATAPLLMVLMLALGGLFQSIGNGTVTALAFSDVSPAQTSQASSFSFLIPRLAQSIGVAVAALILHAASGGDRQIPIFAFSLTFVVIAMLSSLSALWFLQLKPDAGAHLSGHTPKT